MKELCFRCKRPVYPTDKVGPLKDHTFFHHGCFKCYICGTRLTLKTYCHNRNNTDDQEVYCNNHVPNAGPHDPIPHRSNLLAASPVSDRFGSANVISNGGGAVFVNSGPDTPNSSSSNTSRDHIDHHRNGSNAFDQQQNGNKADSHPVIIGDIKIQHALKATELQKPYPKITHPGARYELDYDAQTRLELVHRRQEDDLYKRISQQREEEEARFSQETKEEWEKALNELARRYERESSKGAKARDDLIRQLTLKRDKQRETLHLRLREKERTMTADLIEKQSREMLDLFRQARQMEKLTVNGNGNSNGNGHGTELNGGSAASSTSSYPSTPPPPFPPIGRKRDVYSDVTIFETIDQTAISVAQSEQHSFTDLVAKLTQYCQSDVEKARAIYRWITVKNLNLMDFDYRIDPNTPMGILRGIKYGTESYHVLFKRLCSYAGLHCVVIKGFSKSAGYQPGMKFEDNRFRNTWNAVFLDGSWRFVQCNWGARHLVNARDAPAFPNGRSVSHSENLRYEYDDHYFMTDPEEFIYEFFPHQPEWQLLKRPITLQEFENLPFVRSLFFRYGLSFADAHLRAMVYADKTGAATVAINMTSEAISSLIFHYNLRFYDNEEGEFNGVNLKRFVMQSVVGHSVVFRVHTPCRGDFLLDVFANHVSAGEYLTGQPMKFKSVCKFKIICDHLNVIMVPLPECASGEWGPAKAYRLFGMIPISHEDAIINAGRELEIRFRMSKPLAEFVAALHKNNTDDRKLSKCVTQSLRGDTITFRLQFADEGQYGLDIYTRESSSNGVQQNGHANRHGERQLLTHCCKYLINARL